MNDSSGWFILLTSIFIALGLIMPYVMDITDSATTTNDIEGLADGSPSLTWASSLATAFFWYYGDLSWWANGIKIVLNIFWIYLIVRLFPTIGGG